MKLYTTPLIGMLCSALVIGNSYAATFVASKSYVDNKVEDKIVDNVTNKAPSQNAVYDALANKQNNLGGGTNSGKVVTATATAGTVTYTGVDSTNVVTSGNTGQIPTVGGVQAGIAKQGDATADWNAVTNSTKGTSVHLVDAQTNPDNFVPTVKAVETRIKAKGTELAKDIGTNADAITAEVERATTAESQLNSKIGTNSGLIATNTTNISKNASDIATINNGSVMKSGIDSTKVGQIATNTTNISKNASDIATINNSDVMKSGITSTKVSTYDAYATNKQDKLSTTQLAAANSGITSTKVSTYDAYATNKQNISDSTVAAAADGTYIAITAGNAVGANLKALDGKVKTNAGNISTNTAAIATINDSDVMKSGITSTKVSTYDAYATNKQDKLNTNQLAAVNSGITSTKVSTYDAYATNKQDKLSTTQLAAVNSGITSTKVSTYDAYATNKEDKTNKATTEDNWENIASTDALKNTKYPTVGAVQKYAGDTYLTQNLAKVPSGNYGNISAGTGVAVNLVSLDSAVTTIQNNAVVKNAGLPVSASAKNSVVTYDDQGLVTGGFQLENGGIKSIENTDSATLCSTTNPCILTYLGGTGAAADYRWTPMDEGDQTIPAKSAS